MRKKVIIGFIILILGLLIFFIAVKFIRNGKQIERTLVPIDYIEESEEEPKKEENQEKIKEMINNQGFQADEEIYEVGTEYDGREVLMVKAGIQYKVALAGMLKESKPEFSEIDEILKKAPAYTGIWIAEKDREKFLAILKEITKANYEIDEEGFLIQSESWGKNKYDKKLEEWLTDEKLHIFGIRSTTYLVDEITGEIQEYPFEEMDPYNGYEYFESDDKEMFIMSENVKGKVNLEEVLSEILK